MPKAPTMPTPKDVLHLFHTHSKERIKYFEQLSVQGKTQVILSLSPKTQAKLIKNLPEESALAVLENLDPQKAGRILRHVSDETRKELLSKLSERIQKDTELLLGFDMNTAAGLMNLNYIQFEKTLSILEASKEFKKYEKRTGKEPIMIVTNKGKLFGYLPAYKLGLSKPTDPLGKHVHNLPAISHNTRRKEVIQLFHEHLHEKLAILGEHGNFIGIIYADDVLRLLREKEAESLYDFAGVHAEESVLDPAWYKIKLRYKWLIINLGTAFLAAFTVGLFRETISHHVLLAAYMPIVAGMGGNAATQTLAVLVRGIALKQISLKSAWPTLKNEVTSALANGLINGLIIAAIILLINRDPKMALVLALAMIINLIVAATAGTIIPLIMQALNKDPAASATVFITTATDVLGFIAFLGLASILL